MAMMATFPLEGNPIIDHHPTHLVHHRRMALTDAFRALPKVIQDMFVQHILQAHYLYMFQEQATGMGPTGTMGGAAMAQQQQNAAQAKSGNPGPGNQPKQGGGPGGDSKGPGSSENVNKAMTNPTPLDTGTTPR
jgi:hypothetical protein